jgi:hypothetical protein
MSNLATTKLPHKLTLIALVRGTRSDSILAGCSPFLDSIKLPLVSGVAGAGQVPAISMLTRTQADRCNLFFSFRMIVVRKQTRNIFL